MSSSRPAKRLKRDPDVVEKAVAEVKAKKCSIRKASRNYDIPFGTLHRYLAQPSLFSTPVGANHVLSDTQMLDLPGRLCAHLT